MAAVDDIYEARFVVEMAPQISVNVWHIKIIAVAGTGQSDQQIANHIDGLVSIALKPLLVDDAFYRGVGLKKIFPLPIGIEALGVTNAGAGSSVGVPLPKQISGLISKRTAVAGPGGRGRMYVPFAREEDNEATGQPNAGYITNLGTLKTVFEGLKTAGTLPNTVDYRYGVLRRSSAVINTVTTNLVRTKWATQRRRGDFGRTNVPPF